MSLKVEVQNISGLKGTHNFDFQKGLNIISAPNAQGKTSLLKAIYLIIANENITGEELNNFLTENEITGYVKLEYEKRKMEVVISKNTKGDIEIKKLKVDTQVFPEISSYLSYLRESSKLYQAITSADDVLIQNWYNDMTQVNKFHVAFMTIQDVFHFFENKVDDLEERQDEDVEPIQKLIFEKENALIELNKEKEEISKDPKFISDEKKTKELNKEIANLEKNLKPLKSNEKTITLDLDNSSLDLETIEKEIKELIELKKNLKNTRTTLTTEKESLEHLFFEKDEQFNNLLAKKIEIDELKDEYIRKLNEKEPLKDRSICPLCENKIDKNKMNAYLRELNSKINEALEESISQDRKIKNMKNELNDIKQRIKDIKKEIQDMPKQIDIDIANKKKEKTKIISSIKEKKQNLVNLGKQIKELEDYLN
ncbi:MAG: AAA family ATPase [Candidatus Thorarchaeota archaeon]